MAYLLRCLDNIVTVVIFTFTSKANWFSFSTITRVVTPSLHLAFEPFCFKPHVLLTLQSFASRMTWTRHLHFIPNPINI